MERADKAGIIKILMPAIDSATHEIMLKTEADFPAKCVSMMGLHPCSVMENYVAELNIISIGSLNIRISNMKLFNAR
jgi:TatD DNase family protein